MNTVLLLLAGFLQPPDLDAANELALREAAAKVAPSVVLIETTGGRGRAGSGGPMDGGTRD